MNLLSPRPLNIIHTNAPIPSESVTPPSHFLRVLPPTPPTLAIDTRRKTLSFYDIFDIEFRAPGPFWQAETRCPYSESGNSMYLNRRFPPPSYLLSLYVRSRTYRAFSPHLRMIPAVSPLHLCQKTKHFIDCKLPGFRQLFTPGKSKPPQDPG